MHVEWARPGSRGGQLDVALTRPRGGEPIRLNVKKHNDGRSAVGVVAGEWVLGRMREKRVVTCQSYIRLTRDVPRVDHIS